VHRRSGSQSLYGRLLVRRWCRILVLIIGGDGGGGWPLCNCNKERIASGTFDDSGMQIYASRFAYGTVRRCVIKVGRWYADACEWISKSSQPPQFEIYVEWCGDGSLRLESSPDLGCMRLETLLWFIVYDLSYMILFCGYELDSSTKMTGIYVFYRAYMLALMCQTKNLQYTCYRNYYYEIYTLWLSPESIRSSVLIERLILVALWPWAIDACRDPWRWKRPWWIGKEGKSYSSEMERKPWHLEFSSDYCQASAYDGGRNGAGVHRGLLQ